MSRRADKEITIKVRVSRDIETTAFRILTNALGQFKYKAASLVLKDAEGKEKT